LSGPRPPWTGNPTAKLWPSVRPLYNTNAGPVCAQVVPHEVSSSSTPRSVSEHGPVKIPHPTSNTRFSRVFCSPRPGQYSGTCSGIDTSIRFSSLPVPKALFEITSQPTFLLPAVHQPGGEGPITFAGIFEQPCGSLSRSHTSSQAGCCLRLLREPLSPPLLLLPGGVLGGANCSRR